VEGQRVERRLTAILAADVAGYSRLMGEDEEGTLARLNAHRRELIDPMVAEHHGRIVKTTGDGLLIEFPSVVEAVSCALAVQRAMVERNAATPEEKRITFRIGVNLGDIIVEDGDIYGDGVNIAARLEGIAEPGGICISDDAFRQVRAKVEAEFADIGEQSLKNIARPIRVYRIPIAENATAPTLPLPDKPSIAVLPFANLSGDPEQEYFADGMVEEIITALSRIRWLFVIARNSSFTYKGQAVDVKQVGRELGVRYVLEGSVRKAGGRVRITTQLIDAETGAHLWADRFDGRLEDVFELQDQVAISAAGVVEPTLQAAEIRRSAQRPTKDLTAYDLYLRALPYWDSHEKDGLAQAAEYLGQAIERDPQYGPALALMAHCYVQLDNAGWREINQRRGIDLARQALRSAPEDPEVLARAAIALGYFGEDINAAIGLVDRSLTLNPSFAHGWYWSGVLRNWLGRPDLALDHFETFLRLSPRERFSTHEHAMGMSLFFLRRFDEAVAKFLSAMEHHPKFVLGHRFLAGCYAHMGRLDDAREVVARLRTLTSDVLDSGVRYRNPEYRELFLSGLRLASGETE